MREVVGGTQAQSTSDRLATGTDAREKTIAARASELTRRLIRGYGGQVRTGGPRKGSEHDRSEQSKETPGAGLGRAEARVVEPAVWTWRAPVEAPRVRLAYDGAF